MKLSVLSLLSDSTGNAISPVAEHQRVSIDVHHQVDSDVAEENQPPQSDDTTILLRRLQESIIYLEESLESQKKSIHQLFDAVDKTHDQMADTKRAVEQLRVEMRSKLRGVAPRNKSEQETTPEDAELLVNNIIAVGRKANEVDGLKMHLEIMRHRMERLEEIALGSKSALPAGLFGTRSSVISRGSPGPSHDNVIEKDLEISPAEPANENSHLEDYTLVASANPAQIHPSTQARGKRKGNPRQQFRPQPLIPSKRTKDQVDTINRINEDTVHSAQTRSRDSKRRLRTQTGGVIGAYDQPSVVTLGHQDAELSSHRPHSPGAADGGAVVSGKQLPSRLLNNPSISHSLTAQAGEQVQASQQLFELSKSASDRESPTRVSHAPLGSDIDSPAARRQRGRASNTQPARKGNSTEGVATRSKSGKKVGKKSAGDAQKTESGEAKAKQNKKKRSSKVTSETSHLLIDTLDVGAAGTGQSPNGGGGIPEIDMIEPPSEEAQATPLNKSPTAPDETVTVKDVESGVGGKDQLLQQAFDDEPINDNK